MWATTITGTPLRTASLRLPTMEKGLGENLSSLRTVEPGVPLFETWPNPFLDAGSIRLG